METDLDIIAIARAALAEFGPKAAEVLEKRVTCHASAGEHEGEEFWRRVAAALRDMTKQSTG